jgi:hypothetical protein
MRNPFCIQRAKFETDENAKGIDKHLAMDYMGSSEFEWGALPKSLRRVREQLQSYVMFNYSFKKRPEKVVTVFCKKEQQEFIGDILEQLSEGKLHLQEYCDLSNYVNPETKYRDSDFWWDIDEDWFFWRFTPDFDKKFLDALNEKNTGK